MKRIILITILLASTKGATFWKEVASGSPPVASMTLSGPNQEYIVQRHTHIFRVYQMDWVDNSNPITTSVKDIDLGAGDSNLAMPRVQSDGGFNIVTASMTIYRFSSQPGIGNDFEEYPVPKTKEYAYPFWLQQTNYMFVAARSFINAGDLKAYRLHSDRVTDIKVYNIGTNTRCSGVLYGTNWFVVSVPSSGQRKVFDYTNGYEGGTNNVVGTQSRQSTYDELGMFSPEDGRGYFVVGGSSGTRIYTVKDDGTDLLNHHLSSLGSVGTFVMSPKWIKGTDLTLVATWGAKFAIANFMDTNKPTPSYYTIQGGGSDTYQPQVWNDYKAIILSAQSTDKSYVYKAISETICSELCATCEGVFRKKCLTCSDPNSSKSGDVCSCNFGYYSSNISPTKKQCLACSLFCGTCSGNGATQCLTCRYPYMEKKGDGSCGCPAGKYLSGTSCLACDTSCKTCSGGGPSACLSCAVAGYFLDSGTCQSCASKSSTACPEPLKITLLQRYEELSQNITVIFTPSLLDSQLPSFTPSVGTIIETNLRFKYKRKGEDEKSLTIVEKKLTHESGRSLLYIVFLEKMRTNNTEYVSFSVVDPWVYQTPPGQGQTQPKVIYLKEQEYRIEVEEKEEDQEETNVKRGATLVRAVIGTAASFSILSQACSLAGSSAIYLIKFFNIIDIIANLSKLNVKFGSNLELLIVFIEHLSLPEIKFLARLSPIKDAEVEDPDVNAYQLIPRGSRGKITAGNQDVLIASGQNFAFSLVIILLWILPCLLSLCLNKRNSVMGALSYVYQLMIGMIFFDYQMICFSEISFFNFTALKNASFKFTLSFLISVSLGLLMIRDFSHGYEMIRAHSTEIISEKKSLDDLEISKNDKFILEKYIGDLELETEGIHTYFDVNR